MIPSFCCAPISELQSKQNGANPEVRYCCRKLQLSALSLLKIHEFNVHLAGASLQSGYKKRCHQATMQPRTMTLAYCLKQPRTVILIHWTAAQGWAMTAMYWAAKNFQLCACGPQGPQERNAASGNLVTVMCHSVVEHVQISSRRGS